MANRELRALRNEVHHFFDQLYKKGLMSKEDAYQWLASILAAPMGQAHIGLLGEYYCRQVIEESKKSTHFSESRRYTDSSILIAKLQESIISEHSRLCKIGKKSTLSNYMTPKTKKRGAATPFRFAKLIFRPREKGIGCKSEIPAANNNSKFTPRQSRFNSVVFLRKIAIVLHQQSSSITI